MQNTHVIIILTTCMIVGILLIFSLLWTMGYIRSQWALIQGGPPQATSTPAHASGYPPIIIIP